MDDPVKEFNKALATDTNPQFQSALSKLFASSYSLPAARAKTESTVAIDQQRQQAADDAQANRVQEIQTRLQEIQDSQDPAKYQKVKRADGGFDFFKPDGTNISAGEYAQVLGKNVKDVLEDSDNLNDSIFREGYEGVRGVAEAFQSNDQDALVKALGGSVDKKSGRVVFASKEGEQAYKDFKDGMTVEEYTRKFVNTFRDVFGPTSIGGAPRQGFENLDKNINAPSLGDRFRGIINKINPFGADLDTDPDR